MSENKIMHFLSKSPIIDDSFVVLTHCVNGIWEKLIKTLLGAKWWEK